MCVYDRANSMIALRVVSANRISVHRVVSEPNIMFAARKNKPRNKSFVQNSSLLA